MKAGARIATIAVLTSTAIIGASFGVPLAQYWERQRQEADRVYHHLGVAMYRIVAVDDTRPGNQYIPPRR